MKFVDGVMVGRAIQSDPFFLENVDNVSTERKFNQLTKNLLSRNILII